LERESLEWKKKKFPSWNIGLNLSVQLCYLLNRSKQQYPYFQKRGIYDFFHQNSQGKNIDNKSQHENKNENENLNETGDENINKNNDKNEVTVLDRISHSFFPFISLRGHCWRRVLVDLQHLKATNEEIQYIVSIRILIQIRDFLQLVFFFFFCIL
jgi:hypothetical protein